VLDLRSLLAALQGAPAATDLLQGFVPPPRFADRRFDDYIPDPRHPSQEAAREHLRGVAASLHRRQAPLARVRSLLGGDTR
jgi:cell division protein ZapE